MSLPLPKDVHVPASPDWWPLAPGWWLLLALLVVGVVAMVWWWRVRKRRQDRVLRLFDEAIAAAESAPAQVAAMSDLLRRASRRRDPDADRLEGEAWLDFLDEGTKAVEFRDGAGRLLLDGGFRADVDANEVEVLRRLARRRYLDWMRGA